jgi:hypothetical protein
MLPVRYLILSSVETLHEKALKDSHTVQQVQQPTPSDLVSFGNEKRISRNGEEKSGNALITAKNDPQTSKNSIGTNRISFQDTPNPKTELLTKGEIQTDDKEGIYGFTKEVVDPNACQKVVLAPGKFINISTHIQGKLNDKFIAMLRAYEDVFAWSHEDLKG